MSSPQQNIIFLTNRVGRQLSRLLLEQMEFEGFLPQSTHMGLLADLVDKDGLRQQDLALATIKDKGTVARAISCLEKGDLLRREVDVSDRRQKRIYLTDKGRRMWAYAESNTERALTSATRGISTEDYDRCIDVLQRVYQNLHQQLSIPPTT